MGLSFTSIVTSLYTLILCKRQSASEVEPVTATEDVLEMSESQWCAVTFIQAKLIAKFYNNTKQYDLHVVLQCVHQC